MPRRCVIFIALLIVAGILASTQVSASATPAHKNETELILQALIGSGVEPGSVELEAGTLAIQQALGKTVSRVGKGKEYDAGRFDSAYRIATLEETLHPGRVTTQDRLLAAAQKKIEQLCATGHPDAAAEIREELDRFHFEPVALDLFDRTVNPTIVSAAVRVEDWALAGTFVERCRE